MIVRDGNDRLREGKLLRRVRRQHIASRKHININQYLARAYATPAGAKMSVKFCIEPATLIFAIYTRTCHLNICNLHSLNQCK